MPFTAADVRAFHIDHNSTCNLRCPQCARTLFDGSPNPRVPKRQLELEFYKRIFTPERARQTDALYFCGNYGDVIAATNTLEVVTYLREAGVKKQVLFTNGSLRDPDWWRELARVLNGKVCFSIDGLADTNALYRIGSRFERIMANAEAFISAGGEARWDYLAFPHCEHQVEEARELARKMGFREFKLKRTRRNVQNHHYKGEKPPEGETAFTRVVKKHGSWENYVKSTSIRCKAQAERSLFLDFDGRVWPCTWLGAPAYFFEDDNIQRRQYLELMARYGEDFNSLHSRSLEEVLAHPWFASELEASWNGPKLMTCGRTCGSEYEFSSNAPSNRELVRLTT